MDNANRTRVIKKASWSGVIILCFGILCFDIAPWIVLKSRKQKFEQIVSAGSDWSVVKQELARNGYRVTPGSPPEADGYKLYNVHLLRRESRLQNAAFKLASALSIRLNDDRFAKEFPGIFKFIAVDQDGNVITQ